MCWKLKISAFDQHLVVSRGTSTKCTFWWTSTQKYDGCCFVAAPTTHTSFWCPSPSKSIETDADVSIHRNAPLTESFIIIWCWSRLYSLTFSECSCCMAVNLIIFSISEIYITANLVHSGWRWGWFSLGCTSVFMVVCHHHPGQTVCPCVHKFNIFHLYKKCAVWGLPSRLAGLWQLDELSDVWDLCAVMQSPILQLFDPLPRLLCLKPPIESTPAPGQQSTGCSFGGWGGGGGTWPTLVWPVHQHMQGVYAVSFKPIPGGGGVLANLGCGQSHVGHQPVSVFPFGWMACSVVQEQWQLDQMYTPEMDLMVMSSKGSRIYAARSGVPSATQTTVSFRLVLCSFADFRNKGVWENVLQVLSNVPVIYFIPVCPPPHPTPWVQRF